MRQTATDNDRYIAWLAQMFARHFSGSLEAADLRQEAYLSLAKSDGLRLPHHTRRVIKNAMISALRRWYRHGRDARHAAFAMRYLRAYYAMRRRQTDPVLRAEVLELFRLAGRQQRRILWYRYCGLAAPDIAQRLRITQKTCHAYTTRLRARLRQTKHSFCADAEKGPGL